ncbi:MAG: TonB family protein [Burkholderiales bacterium]
MLSLYHSPSFAAPAYGSRQSRALTIAVVVAVHVAALYGLLQIESVRTQLAEMAPIMINLIGPPKVEVAPPKPDPVKTRPVEKQRVQPVEPAPLITAPAAAASNTAPAPAPETIKPQDSGTPAAGNLPATPPPAIVPPRFDAAYLRNPKPVYPPAAKLAREEGLIVLRVLVGADGEAEKVELRTSSGSARLDESALEAVRKWKFVPARQGNVPLAMWVNVPVSFGLNR